MIRSNSLFTLRGGEHHRITDIWNYTVSLYTSEHSKETEIHLPSTGGTRYILALNSIIKTPTAVIDTDYSAIQTNSQCTAKLSNSEESYIVDIEFPGLCLNDDRVFMKNKWCKQGFSTLEGNLSYMDGGTNTTALNPGRLGLPVVNYVHFPKGMSQTLHTHPSQRIGLILKGRGTIELDGGKVALETGTVFVMDRNVLHNFMCDQDEDVVLFVFAPDSGTGPTDEINPLKVRTYVGQQRV